MRRFEDLVNQTADQLGVPRDVAQALVDTENGARDPNLTSDDGRSYGLVMVQLPTAREYGFAGGPAELLNPSTNLWFGLTYLRAMFRQFGDWRTAYAAYNAGPDLSPWPQAHVDHFTTNLAKERSAGGTVPPVPFPGGAQPAPGAGAGGRPAGHVGPDPEEAEMNPIVASVLWRVVRGIMYALAAHWLKSKGIAVPLPAGAGEAMSTGISTGLLLGADKLVREVLALFPWGRAFLGRISSPGGPPGKP